MTKKNYKYMHTVRGRPAFFNGQQIVIANQYVEMLCEDLNQIKEEQTSSIRWRFKKGYNCSGHEYGYKKVVISHN